MPSPYLVESNWKKLLAKPKNLGLRAQGTGVSEQLRKYEGINSLYEAAKQKTTGGADKVLQSLQSLKTVADQQSKVHKNFAEATKYLQEVVKAVGARQKELADDKKEIADIADRLKRMKQTTDDALKRVATIKKADEWRKGKPLYVDIRALMEAGKFKEVKGDTMAKLNNRVMAEPEKTTDANLEERKKELTGFLNDLKKQLASIKA